MAHDTSGARTSCRYNMDGWTCSRHGEIPRESYSCNDYKRDAGTIRPGLRYTVVRKLRTGR